MRRRYPQSVSDSAHVWNVKTTTKLVAKRGCEIEPIVRATYRKLDVGQAGKFVNEAHV